MFDLRGNLEEQAPAIVLATPQRQPCQQLSFVAHIPVAGKLCSLCALYFGPKVLRVEVVGRASL